jgi:hypothetical protein
MWLALMHPSLGCIEPMAMIAVVEDMKALSFADRKGRARGVTHEERRNVWRGKVEFEEVTMQSVVKSYHLEISRKACYRE